MLLPHQVMIGVPESLRKLTFTITTKDIDKEQIFITTPIQIVQYSLDGQKQTA